MYKFVLLAMIFLVFLSMIPMDSFSHRSGCHRWHSCPSDSGSYGCGDLGYDCRYSSAPSNSSSTASGVEKESSGGNSLNNPSPQASSPATSQSKSSNQPSVADILSEVQDNSQAMVGDICGQIVRGVITLDIDLTCYQDGLIVGQDNTVINLNGHSISGPGESSSKVGIAIPNSNNVVIQGNGSIRNFQAGVLISGSEGTKINGNTFEGNKIGIFTTSSTGTNVKGNFVGSNTIGVGLHSSTAAQVHDNKMMNNSLAGITLVNTDKSQLQANSINGSRNGIMLDTHSTTNMVLNNHVFNNDVDINNADGLSFVANNNELLNNYCSISQPEGVCNSLRSAPAVSQIEISIANEISMLESLHKQGIITDQEFLRMKQALIDDTAGP
jgi:parallel beta-helix repeat protein